MAETGKRALGFFLHAGAITAALLSLLAVSAAAASLSGLVGGGARFPARTLLLSVPPGVPVSVPRLHVSENGKPVDRLSVTPVRAANAGDFGAVIVIDQSQSIRGRPMAQAMAATRAIAAERTGKQELGVITFAQNPSVVLPLTRDPRAIRRALAQTPANKTGTRILPAVMAGLKQLADANVAGGTVILVSDGAATGSGGLTPESVLVAARAQHVRILSVGLRDRSFAPGLLRRLAQLRGGQFVPASAGQLPRVFTGITSALSGSYLLGYQSILPAGQPVAVAVHVDGVPGLLSLSYYAPTAPSHATSSGSTSSRSPRRATSAHPAPHRAPAAKTVSRTPAHPVAGTPAPAVAGFPATTLTGFPPASLRGSPPAPAPGPSSASHPAKTSHPSRLGISGQVPRSVASAAGWVPAKARHSFWTSSLSSAAIAGSCALLIGLAIAVLLFRRPGQRALQRRVHSFTLASLAADPSTPTPGTEAGGPVTQLLTRRRWWPGFAQRVESARMRRSPVALVKRWTVTSIVAAILLAYVTGAAGLGLLLLVVAPLVLKVVVARGVRRQQKRFNEQLPSHLQDLAGAMRGGRSFVGAIAAMAESATEPLRGEFQRALSDERFGLPLEETIEAVGQRMEAKDMEQIALIAALQRGSGSNVAEALDRVAESSRDRADLRREMRALTAQARMSAGVLTGMPPVMLLALMFIAPQYQHPLFHTTGGIVLLFVGSGMLGMAWWLMSKIVNAEA
ncbi:MAG: VWA domain-containing protein [Actinomycetota bacterium]|nr:VWA domain-containing protein [Actinomycetota bacterium]